MVADTNDTFLREIKEEMDRERLEKIWKRYGTLIVGAGALVVVAVAGFQIWTSMQKRAAYEGGAAYEQALEQRRLAVEEGARELNRRQANVTQVRELRDRRVLR